MCISLWVNILYKINCPDWDIFQSDHAHTSNLRVCLLGTWFLLSMRLKNFLLLLSLLRQDSGHEHGCLGLLLGKRLF